MKFETALERLEEIVNSLEDGTLSLDDALKRYEEGVKLARLLTKQLSETEKKIEILTKALSGELEAIPFELPEGDVKDVVSDKDKARQRRKGASDGGRSGAGPRDQNSGAGSGEEKDLF